MREFFEVRYIYFNFEDGLYLKKTPGGPGHPISVITTGVPSCATIYRMTKSLPPSHRFFTPDEGLVPSRYNFIKIKGSGSTLKNSLIKSINVLKCCSKAHVP